MRTIAKPIREFSAAQEDAIYARVTWRLIPFLFTCYLVAYLDRVNVGFAKLQMLADLHFSDTVYGLGAGIFFIGYFVFEVPSNLMLHRVGARLWIARIMLSWGLISGAMMFVNSAWAFYALRFLLGAAEAGFFPGIILYLTYWYPAGRRGQVTSLFLAAVPLSGVVGGPLSGWILQSFAGHWGLAGWQWMFLLEAIPALVTGCLAFRLLKDGIDQVDWLTPEEKAWMTKRILQEAEAKQEYGLLRLFRSLRLWQFSLVYFSLVMGLYGLSFWLPTLIKDSGIHSELDIGLLSAIPYAAAIIGMLLVSISSDRYRERRWHLVLPSVLGAAGLICSVLFATDPWLAIIALSIAAIGVMAALPLFWSLPTAYLRGVSAAAGIAWINSIGNLSGFLSPYLIGLIKDMTGSTAGGIYMLAGSMFVGALLVLCLPKTLLARA